MTTFNLMKCAALALLAVFASGSQAFACNSGPDFCTDDSRIPSALVAKKQALKKQGYPDRLVSLIDRGVQCVARIREEPDGFHVIDVGTDGSKNDLSWDADEERIAKGNLTSGASVRYWIVNLRHAFTCDGQKPFNEQPDYDAADDVNANGAIKCELQGGAVSCTP